jgi:phosphatidylethanolamine-binding protein (PEBP) family uncharacterized protein
MAMTLTSPRLQNGQIPSKHTCKGDDISPPLAWEGVPEGTPLTKLGARFKAPAL